MAPGGTPLWKRSRRTHVFEVAEGDELDNVPENRFPFGRPQDPIVSVQHLHVAEVGVTDPHDDDGHGEVGGLNDGLPRVCHVGDNAVRQDQQDEVLLRDEDVTTDLSSFSREAHVCIRSSFCLTMASLVWSSCEAELATFWMMGAMLVGP